MEDVATLIFGGEKATEFFIHGEGATLGFAQGPERALFAALLFDGVQAYIRCREEGLEGRETELREANDWVQRKGDDYVFSFENVCLALGICPEYMRFGLANAGNAILKTRRERQAVY